MTPIKWRNPYDEKENRFYDELTQIDCTDDPGVTQQAPAEEQDINVIMRRFGVTDGSVIPRWTSPKLIYGDFSEVPSDPQEAQEYLRQGQLAFMTLPGNVRQKFTDAAELYNWLHDPNNLDEAVKMGLLEAPKTPVVSSSTSSDKEPLVQP